MDLKSKISEALKGLELNLPEFNENQKWYDGNTDQFIDDLNENIVPFEKKIDQLSLLINTYILDNSINRLDFSTDINCFDDFDFSIGTKFDQFRSLIEDSNIASKKEFSSHLDNAKQKIVEKKIYPVLNTLTKLENIVEALRYKYTNKNIIDQGYTLQLYDYIESLPVPKIQEDESLRIVHKDIIIQYCTHVNILALWIDHNLFIPTKNFMQVLKIKNYLDKLLFKVRDTDLFSLYEREVFEKIVLKYNVLIKKQLEEYLLLKNDSEDENLDESRNFTVFLDNQPKKLNEWIPNIQFSIIDAIPQSTKLDINKEKIFVDNCKSELNYSDIFAKATELKKEILKINDKEVFHKYCFELFHCYTFLNGFSVFLLTKNSQDDIPEIEGYLKKALSLLNKYKIKNYYPYRKFTQHFTEIISSETISDNDFHTYYAKIEDSLEMFQLHMDWCKHFGFVTFLANPHSNMHKVEYFIDEEKIEHEISIVSGNTDPIDYNFEKREFEKYKMALSQIEQRRKLHKEVKNLKNTYDSIDSKINDTKEKLKDSEKNSIQILGIFSAIVLFTTGSISFFKENMVTPAQSVAFILGYGFVLVLFIIVLHYVFYYRHSDDEVLQKNQSTLLRYLFIGLLVIGLFITINTEPFFSWLKSLF